MGYGTISVETFDWLKKHLTGDSDWLMISGHHHMVKETTVGSGDWEGVDNGYHGRLEQGAPRGASYLHFVGDEADSGKIESLLDANPGALNLWLGGHTHTFPDDHTAADHISSGRGAEPRS